jgi:hypothetical protein
MVWNISSIISIDISLKLVYGLLKVKLISVSVQVVSNCRMSGRRIDLIDVGLDSINDAFYHMFLRYFTSAFRRFFKFKIGPYLHHCFLIDAYVFLFHREAAHMRCQLLKSLQGLVINM